MYPLKVPPEFLVVAHRGASAYAPENTLASFKLARAMGARAVELDTQLTSDGKVVLCHDLNLERYGHGNRVVEEMPAGELLALDMGSWFSPHLFGGEPMILLDTLFETFGNEVTYHVELKGTAPGLPAAVVDIIGAHELYEHCVVTCFSIDRLHQVHERDPNIRLEWIVKEYSESVEREARKLPIFKLGVPVDNLTSEVVTQARAVVEQVHAWAISGSMRDVTDVVEKAVAIGCSGLTTDWPDRITSTGT